MNNQKQLDESKLMTAIENLVKSFKDYIESHNETFDTSESKVIDGPRNALDIVMSGDSDDKSLLIAKHEDYRTYVRCLKDVMISSYNLVLYMLLLDSIELTIQNH